MSFVISKATISHTKLYCLSLIISLVVAAYCFAQPAITKQPTDQSVSLGANLTFQVSATSATPILYQWRHDTVSLEGRTNSNLTLINIQVMAAGGYDVVLSASCRYSPTILFAMSRCILLKIPG